jgi:hypothetical protein
MKSTIPRRGAYAAHIGYPMFGARGPQLAPEDGGNGAGAAGGESTTTATTTAAATTSEPVTAPGGTSEKMVPQSQVDALVGKARREGRDSALKEKEAPPPAKKAAPKGEEAMSRAEYEQARARDRAFTRATAAAGLSDVQLTRMERALEADNPPDVAEWSKAYLEDMGLVKPPTNNAQQNSGAPAAPAPPAAAAPSAPSKVETPIVNGGMIDLYGGITPEQFAAYTPQQIREIHEKNVAAANSRVGAPPVPQPRAKR